MNCKKCGMNNAPENKYCTLCGAKIESGNFALGLKNIVFLLIILLTFFASYFADTMRSREDSSAKKFFHKIIHAIKDKEAKTHFNRAWGFHKKRKFDDAIKEYQKTLAVNPAHVDAHNNIAAVYVDKNMPDEAIKHCKEAIKYNPFYPKPYYNMAVAYYEKRNLDEAIPYAQKAIKLNPQYSRPYYLLAIIYYDKNEYPLAVDYCQKSEKLGFKPNPNFLKKLDKYKK